jgi:hypothetical protein
MTEKRSRRSSRGICELCGAEFGKAAAARHLRSCLQSSPADERAKKARLLHLVVEGRYLPEFWLHVEADARAPLAKLDAFLRDIWLECCGHLSQFTVGERRFVSHPIDDNEGMNAKIGSVLTPKTKALHEYDFGTTTELTIRVVGEREASVDEPVRLLARNLLPEFRCHVCQKKATEVCTECMWDADPLLCDDCAADHEHDEEMFLPVVNSPRIGMCGYSG